MTLYNQWSEALGSNAWYLFIVLSSSDNLKHSQALVEPRFDVATQLYLSESPSRFAVSVLEIQVDIISS